MQISNQQCSICLETKQQSITLSECKHSFCFKCTQKYLDTLKNYNELNPAKLICMYQGCLQQLPDSIIHKLYPGEVGFLIVMVRKRYKQSKDPNIKIFNCKGFTKENRSLLIEKPASMSRDLHSQLINQKFKSILIEVQKQKDIKNCTNILSFNKLNTKNKCLHCYVCGASYCTFCQDFFHESQCQHKNIESQIMKYTKNLGASRQQNNDIESYIKANLITKCLNPKCGLPIAKQEGCYWVKCRCSWQLCYPCQKLWGDCFHFSKYPYEKFIPPPEWMVKALNLY